MTDATVGGPSTPQISATQSGQNSAQSTSSPNYVWDAATGTVKPVTPPGNEQSQAVGDVPPVINLDVTVNKPINIADPALNSSSNGAKAPSVNNPSPVQIGGNGSGLGLTVTDGNSSLTGQANQSGATTFTEKTDVDGNKLESSQTVGSNGGVSDVKVNVSTPILGGAATVGLGGDQNLQSGSTVAKLTVTIPLGKPK